MTTPGSECRVTLVLLSFDPCKEHTDLMTSLTQVLPVAAIKGNRPYSSVYSAGMLWMRGKILTDKHRSFNYEKRL